MQYVQIYINRPTAKSFLYKPTSQQLAYIKPGVLVKVPFGVKTEWGIIKEIVKSKKGLEDYKLKNILDIYPNIELNTLNFELAKWLKTEYLTTFSESLFIQLPAGLPKKIAKLSYLPPKNLPQIRQTQRLIINHTEKESTLTILIKKAVKNNKSVRLFIPDLSKLEKIKTMLEKETETEMLIHSSRLTPTKKLQMINHYYNHQAVLIGGRSLGLILPKDNEIWIIEEPENYAYKNDQTPKFHLNRLIEFLGHYVPIITLNYFPASIATISKNKYLKTNAKLPFTCPIIIKPENELTRNLSILDIKNSIVILPNNQFGFRLFCPNCFTCAKSICCESDFMEINKTWVCKNCKTKPENLLCRYCHQSLIMSKGGKYEQIQKSGYKNISAISESELDTVGQTEQLILAGFDYLIDSSNIRSVFEYIELIAKCTHHGQKLYIFSDFANHQLLRLINQQDINGVNNYFKNLSIDTKNIPYYRIIKLTIRKSNRLVNEKLSKILGEIAKIDPLISIVQSPIYSTSENKTIISIPLNVWKRFSIWNNNNEKLIGSDNWIIDIDPYKVV